MGRPSDFSPELAERICSELAEGKSLRAICAAEDMPSDRAVYKWLASDKYPEFVQQYAHARERQADFYADEIIEIADLCDDPQKARLQVDARKWKASKLAPKKYGDKVTQEVTGQDGGPVVTEVKWTIVKDHSAEDSPGV